MRVFPAPILCSGGSLAKWGNQCCHAKVASSILAPRLFSVLLFSFFLSAALPPGLDGLDWMLASCILTMRLFQHPLWMELPLFVLSVHCNYPHATICLFIIIFAHYMLLVQQMAHPSHAGRRITSSCITKQCQAIQCPMHIMDVS